MKAAPKWRCSDPSSAAGSRGDQNHKKHKGRTEKEAEVQKRKKGNFKFKKRTPTLKEAPAAQERMLKQRISELMSTTEDTPAQNKSLNQRIADLMASIE